MKPPIPLQIEIPEPCSQSWEDMQPVSGGRHCTRCQKNVVDFTRMNDAAFIAYINNYGLGCGRFRDDQINRPIALPFVKKKNVLFRWAAGLLLMMGIHNGAQAQQRDLKVDTAQRLVPEKRPTECEAPGEITPMLVIDKQVVPPSAQAPKSERLVFMGGGRATGETVVIDEQWLAKRRKDPVHILRQIGRRIFYLR